jgi:hypothetical protein
LTQISDAVVLSYRIERGPFRKAIFHAAFLGNVCVRRGYLPRGVITTGKLVHDPDRLYGGGLIDAYNAERQHVIDPRIAIDARVMEEFRKEFAQDGNIGRAALFVRNRGTGNFRGSYGAPEDERNGKRTVFAGHSFEHASYGTYAVATAHQRGLRDSRRIY